MNRNYQESWYKLIQYLNDADYIYFAREGNIEIVVNDTSVFINCQSSYAVPFTGVSLIH